MGHQYMISDVAKMLAIEPHVLRYWEEELNLKIFRNKLGHRYYSDTDMEVLKRIKSLKEQGLQLRAIKVLLEANEKETEKSEDFQLPIESASQNITSHKDKLQLFQVFIEDVFSNTLRENNQALLEGFKSEMHSSLKEVMAHQESLDERRYRKLDETIREMQKARLETAATGHKRKGWLKIKKKDKSSK